MMMVKVEGLDALQSKLRNLPQKAVYAVRDIMKKIVADLKGKAQRITPVDLGDLVGSAYDEVNAVQNGVAAEVGFDIEYATRQHEELTFVHRFPGQAKYLETPLNENIDRYIEMVGDAAMKAMEDGHA